MALRFVAEHEIAGIPNVVVDGSPNPDTVLTLSHWPGSPTPVELLERTRTEHWTMEGRSTGRTHSPTVTGQGSWQLARADQCRQHDPPFPGNLTPRLGSVRIDLIHSGSQRCRLSAQRSSTCHWLTQEAMYVSSRTGRVARIDAMSS